MKDAEDEEFDRIAAKCKETERVNESKWNSEMCSNYGGFCKKEWVGLTKEEIEASKPPLSNDAVVWELAVEWAEAKLKEKNT